MVCVVADVARLFQPHWRARTWVPAVRKEARSTEPWCPAKVRMHVPPCASDHILMVLSPAHTPRPPHKAHTLLSVTCNARRPRAQDAIHNSTPSTERDV